MKPAEPVEMLKRIRTLLPLQNPLISFTHNNLLMAWEPSEFWEGSLAAARKYEADFPKPLHFYQSEALKGRISAESLLWALRMEEAPNNSWRPARTTEPNSVEQLLLGLLQRANRHAADPLLKGPTVDGGTVPITLWGVPRRERSAIFPAWFREWFCGTIETYLDQGVAAWNNPFRELGLMEYAKASLKARAFSENSWANKLYRALGAHQSPPALTSLIEQSSMAPAEFEEHLLILGFSFKGWLGMVNKAETEPAQFPICAVQVRLEDALIILLSAHNIFFGGKSMAAMAREAAADDLGQTVMLSKAELGHRLKKIGLLSNATPADGVLNELSRRLNELDRFRTARVWHHAYEDSLYRVALGTLSHGSSSALLPTTEASRSLQYQVLTCMDDREESFRRHLEEVSPSTQTFGVLGNFNLAIKYLGLGNPKPRQQCPPVVTPERTLYETLTPSNSIPQTKGTPAAVSSNWEKWASAILRWPKGSWVRSILSSIFLGFAAVAPLLSRVVFPTFGVRLRGAWRTMARRIASKGNVTHISLERENHPLLGPCGFTIEEQAANLVSVLKPLDIHLNWAPLVFAIAHQSTSDNNPFMQAYGCGACSGHSGISNSRAFVSMANSEAVRAVLRDKYKYIIAPTTQFVAVIHDTTSDQLQFFPPQSLSSEQSHILHNAKLHLRKAAARNCYERTQFFANSPKGIHPSRAIEHCIVRSQSLAEPRPEYGHNRVAIAVYGPRAWTQSLCFDRRAFLVSYHQEQDTENADTLRDLIHGSLPVVANIGLDYFFSAIDSHGFGAGSKLPLNISALLGVVSGSRGDLRVGLAQQMIEIHEPVRPMAVVQANREALMKIIREHARLARLVGGGWLRVVAFDRVQKRFYALENWVWNPIELPEVTVTSFPRWDLLHSLPIGGPLSEGNSLQRWGHKPVQTEERPPLRDDLVDTSSPNFKSGEA
jgi:uncharacterized protein